MLDWVIRCGSAIDGNGGPRRRADIVIFGPERVGPGAVLRSGRDTRTVAADGGAA